MTNALVISLWIQTFDIAQRCIPIHALLPITNDNVSPSFRITWPLKGAGTSRQLVLRDSLQPTMSAWFHPEQS
jgi:hypothetical protein